MGSVDDIFCPFCVIDFDTISEFDKHRGTYDHRSKYLEKSYRKNRKEFLKDKNGFSVDVDTYNSTIIYKPDQLSLEIITGGPHVDSTLDPETETDEEKFSFTLRIIKRQAGNKNIYLTSIDVLNRMHLVETDSAIEIEDEYTLSENLWTKNTSSAGQPAKIIFKKGSIYEVPCTLLPGKISRPLHIPILFEFCYDKWNEPPFYIGKTIEIKGAAYRFRDFGDYVPGVYPTSWIDPSMCLERELFLFKYAIPLWFQREAFNNEPQTLRKKMNISEKVTAKTHYRFFQCLLWLEELQQEIDIQFYSRKNVRLNFPKNSKDEILLVDLQENGLSENRPCIMRKDKLFVCTSKEASETSSPSWYLGYVHEVRNNVIRLGFHQEKFVPIFDDKTEFNIEFVLNRHCLKVCHRALSLCQDTNLKQLLEPPIDFDESPLTTPLITPYDVNINHNPEQMQAVQHIVQGSSGNSPYIIFGPPGTGKTVTVVESIKQVLFNNDRSQVLACAPSNSAADVLALKLLEHFTDEHVYRIYAESRSLSLNNLPENLVEASNYFREMSRTNPPPPKAELMEKRVIVTTFITAAQIASACFPKGFFTHVFLDEVGHAQEPEALVAVGGILSLGSKLILAGDPHQLGPVIQNLEAHAGSRFFPHTGLDTSLLDRLMTMPRYQKVKINGQESFNPRYVTKLVNNYRSHSRILLTSSLLFYDSELQAKGDASVVNRFLNWSHLPKKNFPLIFHSVDGIDKQEKNSPSFFNMEEVEKVISYLGKLLNGEIKLSPSEIGIITPYRLQVEKLRNAISSNFPAEFSDIKIGSVENFQGDERPVIIVSTVRASKAHLCKDHWFKLGFLKNPKRFNVAITRPQSLLILIGCSNVLMLDKNWKCYINFIRDNEGHRGAEIKEPRESIDDILKANDNFDFCPKARDMKEWRTLELPIRKFEY